MNRNFPDSSPGLLLVDSEMTASLSRVFGDPVWIPAQRPYRLGLYGSLQLDH
jgi:hypothetical protein